MIATYLKNLISEKSNLDLNAPIEVMGASGINMMTLETVVEHILIAPAHEQKQIRATLVKIDFLNGDCMHFFKHLAQAIAC